MRLEKQKWSDLFARNRDRENGCALKYIPPTVSNGVRVAKFQGEAMKWHNALVGSVYGMVPRFVLIESFAMNKWKKLGLKSVHLVKENVFLFNF